MLQVSTPLASASARRSRQFHERIAAIHAYKVMKGIDPAPFWPGMWMWDLVEMPPKRAAARVDAIIDAVCELYSVSRPEMCSPSRHMIAIRARHVFCYLARKMTRLSFERIGAKINRDHSTALYAFNKVMADARVDPVLAAQLDRLTRGLS